MTRPREARDGCPPEKTRTPGIYKRGSRYVFSYRDASGKQRWESSRTYDEARRGKSARKTDISRGEFQERSRQTFQEYARGWVERYQGRGRRGFREDTRDDYRRQLEQYAFRYFPAKTRMTEVTPSAAADFVGWLCDPSNQSGRELADSTVRNIMAPLRACFATAVREGVVRSNPTRDVDLPNRQAVEDDEEDVRALTREQLDAFLRAAPAGWRTFFHVLAVTGLRISEALALEWRHRDLNAGSPHIKVRQRVVRGKLGPPKSKHGRRDVPIPYALVAELRQLRADSEWPRDTDPVFPSTTGTRMLPSNLFRRVLKPTAKKAGVPWIGFHTFRHTCASMLIAEGRNIVQVSRWLGHHSPSFTLAVYASLMDDGVGTALDLESANEVQTSRTSSDDNSDDAVITEMAA